MARRGRSVSFGARNPGVAPLGPDRLRLRPACRLGRVTTLGEFGVAGQAREPRQVSPDRGLDPSAATQWAARARGPSVLHEWMRWRCYLGFGERVQTIAGRCAHFQHAAPALIVTEDTDGRRQAIKVAEPAHCTLEFVAGGSLVARIDCNRGRGTRKSSSPTSVGSGSMALTRTMCPHL